MTITKESMKTMQYYSAVDFLNDGFFVNKRVPLTVFDIAKDNAAAVLDRLKDLYGPEKTTSVENADGSAVEAVALKDVDASRCSEIVLTGQKLTEHQRFDFSDLQEIMRRLRGEGGCEWDRAQDHKSIRINLIEEAYELVEAIDCDDRDMMLEESGDVMMQAVFHTQIAEEGGEFGYGDMFTTLCRKLLDRHTHIFGENHADNADEALVFWNEAKKKEKKYKSNADAMDRVPKNLPSLLYAEKIQKIAKKCGFDWPNVTGATDKVAEELAELIASAPEDRAEEAGDLLFAVVNVLRFYKIDPEIALRAANAKFLRRFAETEKIIEASGRGMSECTLEEMDKAWDEVKRQEKNDSLIV